MCVLQKKNHILRLMIKYHHESEGHQMGVNYTLNHLGEKYLVIPFSREVKQTERATNL